jgi:hypothetical protein
MSLSDESTSTWSRTSDCLATSSTNTTRPSAQATEPSTQMSAINEYPSELDTSSSSYSSSSSSSLWSSSGRPTDVYIDINDINDSDAGWSSSPATGHLTEIANVRLLRKNAELVLQRDKLRRQNDRLRSLFAAPLFCFCGLF